MADDLLILVGAKPYPLSFRDVALLIGRLRQTYPSQETPRVIAAHNLARALDLILEGPEEELELSLPQVEPVLEAMKGAPLSPALLRLQHGLRQLRGDELGN